MRAGTAFKVAFHMDGEDAPEAGELLDIAARAFGRQFPGLTVSGDRNGVRMLRPETGARYYAPINLAELETRADGQRMLVFRHVFREERPQLVPVRNWFGMEQELMALFEALELDSGGRIVSDPHYHGWVPREPDGGFNLPDVFPKDGTEVHR